MYKSKQQLQLEKLVGTTERLSSHAKKYSEFFPMENIDELISLVNNLNTFLMYESDTMEIYRDGQNIEKQEEIKNNRYMSMNSKIYVIKALSNI